MNNDGVQYFTFDLTGKNSICWGGPGDGAVHYPIMFDSFIIDSTRKASGSNTIGIFPFVLVYGE